jgi:hypothetical protein
MRNLEDLVNKYGTKGILFEQFIYRMAERFSKEYSGGVWSSKQVAHTENTASDVDSVHGFYLELDDDKMYSIQNTENGYDNGEMDSKTFSLCIFVYACNIAGFHAHERGELDFAQDLFKLYYYCQTNALNILQDEKKHSQYYWFLD